ncbi:MAG: hypothetical protein K0R66_1251 [Gammaproteobacteria bacterium]|jgi:hypothetical protein|nr:hypothetical protein [Gammaproteobacteria bacterium]
MPEQSLHMAVYNYVRYNKRSAFEKCINKLKNQGGDKLKKALHSYDRSKGGIPIFNVFNRQLDPPDYEIAIRLLDEGTLPAMRCGEYGASLFHFAISEQRLSLFRLLLWYEPNYEHVIDNHNKATAQQRVAAWDHECPGFQSLIEETAADSKKVREYAGQAEFFLQERKLNHAAHQYAKIGEIYAKHARYEDYDGGQYLKTYYQKKALPFLQKSEALLHEITEYPYPDAIVHNHKLILSKLVAICEALGKKEEALTYKAYRGMLELSLRPQQNYPIFTVSSESTAPFLAAAQEILGMQQSLQQGLNAPF